MKTKTLVFTAALAATLAAVPTYAYAVCSPSTENLSPVRAAVSEELAGLAPYNVGADRQDMVWVKDHIVEMVPEWLPATKRVAEQTEPELTELVDECYEDDDEGDLDLPNFLSCVKNSMLTDVLSHAATDLPAACDEISEAVEDPDIENKARAWAQQWVAEYIQYREAQPNQ
jgi:hypothetical protein